MYASEIETGLVAPIPPLARIFVLKIAELCNLNCSYCYMYNKGDRSFRDRPKFMSREIASAVLTRIASYAVRRNLRTIALALHGGEPLLAGREWMQWFLQEARRIEAGGDFQFEIGVQTNATLLDSQWIEMLSAYGASIGVSCDGPEEWNDRERRDFDGRGSYQKVRTALELLAATPGVSWGVLTVVNPDAPPKAVLKHFVDLGAQAIEFIWPDYNHDNPPPWPPGKMASYFCELFDYWYGLPSPPEIRWFESAISLLLGGPSRIDALGPDPLTYITVESGGTWEPLDTLRICGNGITCTSLDVRTCDVETIWTLPLYQIGLRNQDLLPPVCNRCAYRSVCGGGYLPHRFRRDTGFSNPSVYCAELLAVLSHIWQRIAPDIQKLRAVSTPR